ncbi:MAG: hypothetical protein PHZ07_00585 [Patescibacteria group bacterium]|nr:hypothetical protein [Patescibacteria group bacterium]MDD4304218.1 hypothetical protein [Patescibacteria group bacterium]MDD4695251.1 hypothetical protein [Patescibacteria group bacterium]
MEQKIEKGKTLAQWHFPEFEPHDRNLLWYILLFVIATTFVIYSIITINFLFAVIVVMVVIILLMQNRKNPQEMEISIKEAGIDIGEKFYHYNNIKDFFIIYQPPEISNLYLELKNGFKTRLSIPLKNQNPVKTRDILLTFLEENLEREEEPTSDLLSRMLKF